MKSICLVLDYDNIMHVASDQQVAKCGKFINQSKQINPMINQQICKFCIDTLSADTIDTYNRLGELNASW